MASMRLLRGASLVLGLAALSVAAAQSEWRSVFSEQFGDDKHPLYVMAGVIPFGQQQDTPFVASLAQGGLLVENGADSSVIRYYFVEPRHAGAWNDAAHLPTAVSVLLSGQYGEFPGAGIVYRVEPTNQRFYAFVLTGGQGYGIYVLDQQGYRALSTGESAAVQSAGVNELIVLPDGDFIHMVVNGELVGTLDTAAQPGGPTGYGAGILVAGTGSWLFDDFEVFVR